MGKCIIWCRKLDEKRQAVVYECVFHNINVDVSQLGYISVGISD